MSNTDWKAEYRKKLCTAEEAARSVRDGDLILTAICLGQPTNLIMDAIADRKDELKDVEYRANLSLKPYKILKPEYRSAFKITTAFNGSPLLQACLKEEGYSNYAPATVFGISKQWTSYRKPDVAVCMVTPPDKEGFVNLGPDLMYTRTIIEGRVTSRGVVGGARTVIAEVNDQYIPAQGNTRMHISRFAHFVENSTPLPAMPNPVPKEVHRKIAENVVSLLRDRDTIQIGIGAVPMIVSDLIANSNLKDLGIFTEMLPSGAPIWLERGILTGKYQNFRPGEIIASFMGPVKELYDFVRDNPIVKFLTPEITNNPAILGAEEQMVGINGALEVDLVGQVASTSLGYKLISGYGGQIDFAMACKMSKFGRFIITLGSTAKDAQGNLISRIVPSLQQGSLVGTIAPLVDYVVTENGIAGPLDGLTFGERAEALIKIAHPKFQDDLIREAKARGILR